MKFLNRILVLLIILFFTTACENEVEINSDFEEVTVVFGLLDRNSDTQFVKINRTFLDDKLSAIDLAKQSERLYYDNLSVSLISDQNDSFPLSEIIKPKDLGVFSTEDNVLYFTTEKLNPNINYQLRIIKPDRSETYGSTRTIDTINILKPRLGLGSFSSVQFTNFRGTSIADYRFEFSTGNNIGEFEIRMNFLYEERTSNGDIIPKKVSMNVGKVLNPSLERGSLLSFTYSGRLFFEAIENQVTPSTEPTKKIISKTNNIEIEIYAADGDYSFYRDLNGPIEGLAQTRPEFTNIENGIGLFASRFSMIATTQIDQETRNYLVQTYRENRNFSTD